MKNTDMCKRSKRRENRVVDHGGKGSREKRSHLNMVCYSDGTSSGSVHVKSVCMCEYN